MPKIVLHRHTLATYLFLLSTCSPCAGAAQKSPQDIDGQKLLEAIQDIDDDEDGRKAKATALALLNKTPTPNLHFKEKQCGDTSLHWASAKGETDIVKLLLEKRANPDSQDHKNVTPLHDAVENGHPDVVQLLLQYKADKSILNNKGQTPLDLARTLPDDQDKTTIIQLLEPTPAPSNISPNLNQDQGSNFALKPLSSNIPHDASNENISLPKPNTNASTPSTQDNTNTNTTNDLQDQTTTHWFWGLFTPYENTTAERQQDADNKGLLEAIMDMEDDFDHNKAIVIALLNQQPTPNLEVKDDVYEATPLHWAAGQGYEEITQLLLEKGADQDALDGKGETPLHIAVAKQHLNIVQLLLRYKADKSILNNDDKTPLDLGRALPDSLDKTTIIQLVEPTPAPSNTSPNLNQDSNFVLKPLSSNIPHDASNENISLPKPTQPNTTTLPTNPNTNVSPPSTQDNTNTTNDLQDQKTTNPLTKENTIKGAIILVLCTGIGYILWPKQDYTPPLRTNKRKQKRIRKTNTAK